MKRAQALNRLYLIFIILFFVLTGYALENDEQDLKLLNEKAELLIETSPEEGIKLLEKVIKLSDASSDKLIKAQALKTTGIAHYYLQNYRQSFEYYEQALAIYREANDREGIASILNNTALLLEIQGDFSLALKRYNESALIFTELGNEIKLSIILSNIGNIYYTLGRFDNALTFLSQSLKMSESLSDTAGIARAYNNIGNIYLSMNDFSSAAQFYHKSEKIHKNNDDFKRLPMVYNNLGEAYLGLKQIDKALNYNKLSLEMAQKNNDYEGIISSLVSIGGIYCELNEYDLANSNFKEALRVSNQKRERVSHANILKGIGKLRYLKQDYDDAINAYNEALSLVEKTGPDLLLQEIYKGLSVAWEAKGNYIRAYQNLSRHTDIVDSIYNRDNLNRLNMVRVSFEMEQTERDNQLLRQQNIYSQQALKKQQTIRNLLIVISAIIITFLTFILLLYLSKKKKNELLAVRNKQVLAQKEELDKLYLEQYKLNDIKNKFFSIIAHDLKSPFQSLLGFSELLADGYEQYEDKQRKDMILNMYKVTNDTYNLIENLLEWGRIQTGASTAVIKVVNIKDLVMGILPVFDSPLKEKNLKITFELPPLLMAKGDPYMLGAVLRNLISNAIKFSNPDSTIHVKGSFTNDSVILQVVDTGIGMTPDIIEKLFTFNPSVRRPGTKGETGTGMGLGLCIEFMQLNNGVITVDSKPGLGSTFSIVIPQASREIFKEKGLGANQPVQSMYL